MWFTQTVNVTVGKVRISNFEFGFPGILLLFEISVQSSPLPKEEQSFPCPKPWSSDSEPSSSIVRDPRTLNLINFEEFIAISFPSSLVPYLHANMNFQSNLPFYTVNLLAFRKSWLDVLLLRQFVYTALCQCFHIEKERKSTSTNFASLC